MRAHSVVTFAFLLLGPPALSHAQTKVAVLPLEAKTGVDEKTAQLLTDVITTEASKRADLRVVGPSDVKSLLSFEQQKAVLGCTDNSCLAEIGAALGVDAILTGSIGQLGSALILNLSLIDIKNTTVLARATEQVDGGAEKVLPVLPHVVGTVMAGLPGGPPPPPRPAAAVPVTQGGPVGNAGAQGGGTPGEGGSSLPRRIAGIGLVGVAGLLLVAGLGLGGLSILAMAAGKVVIPGQPASLLTTVGGFGLAGGADLVGITSVLVLVTGIVIAALP
jgi:TolB-like protein